MINNITIVGRIANDLELKNVGKEGAVKCEFTIAVDGIGEEETSFIPVEIGNKQAQNLVAFQTKGSLVGITGRLTIRQYEDKFKNKKSYTQVKANNVQFLESKKEKEADNGQNTTTQAPKQKPIQALG